MSDGIDQVGVRDRYGEDGCVVSISFLEQVAMQHALTNYAHK